ncbi:hypothetical protein EW145_g5149 [Phellinidium pouzarii]|uniref:histone acetyltransferase n=1 Tax=Phellinidium pouzarii TaxID=167371 RepID=A0A4S4L2D7_9AGAM|nr:hypothetical protein EW145_g5149 [Phellinidium pouzarii]
MKLRDTLLDALSSLPGTRTFHLHVLLSSPRKHNELYPYATARPRVYAQDVLILCSEQQPAPGAPRVLVSAIEVTLYHIPSTSSALLYIAKVDSTGQGTRPAPTAPLVHGLMMHYVDPRTRPPRLAAARIWVHLFARAQRQYLFPNSADHPAKRPLGDVALCAWWKRVLTRVAREFHEKRGGALPQMYYVLPGMSELEATQALGQSSVPSSSEGIQWVYGHPYAQTDLPLPYAPKARDGPSNLGQLIPSFDDDPKARFMDEIACTTQVDGMVSPKRKRRKTSRAAEVDMPDGDEVKERVKGKGKERERDTRVHGELGVVSADEFWERMSFRQECIAGAVTGFFIAVFSSSIQQTQTDASPLAPQPDEVTHQMVQRIATSLMTGHDFSSTERTVKATEILEGSIKGLCGGVHAPTATTTTTNVTKEIPPFLLAGAHDSDNDKEKDQGRTTPEPARESTPPPLFLAPPQTPPPRAVDAEGKRVRPMDGHGLDGISPNLFPEPEPTKDTYESYIYGTVKVDSPLAEAVTAGEGKPAGGAHYLAVANDEEVDEIRLKTRLHSGETWLGIARSHPSPIPSPCYSARTTKTSKPTTTSPTMPTVQRDRAVHSLPSFAQAFSALSPDHRDDFDFDDDMHALPPLQINTHHAPALRRRDSSSKQSTPVSTTPASTASQSQSQSQSRNLKRGRPSERDDDYNTSKQVPLHTFFRPQITLVADVLLAHRRQQPSSRNRMLISSTRLPHHCLLRNYLAQSSRATL